MIDLLPSSPEHQNVTIVALSTLGGIVTLIIQNYFQSRTATRRATEHRQSRLDDIEALKAETEKIAIQLKLKQEETALETRRLAIINNKNLVAEVREVKQVAQDAFKEANSVNQKLQNIGVQMRDGKELSIIKEPSVEDQ